MIFVRLVRWVRPTSWEVGLIVLGPREEVRCGAVDGVVRGTLQRSEEARLRRAEAATPVEVLGHSVDESPAGALVAHRLLRVPARDHELDCRLALGPVRESPAEDLHCSLVS